MYYEINVSLYGRHLFATHQRSVTTWDDIKTVITIFKEKFKEKDGYKISVTEHPEIAHPVDISGL